jgi:CBS domain-containing protein
MRHDFVTAEPRDMLHTALVRLQGCESRTLPVVENGRLLGLLTAENLAETLMIQDALRTADGRHRAPPRPWTGVAGTPTFGGLREMPRRG